MYVRQQLLEAIGKIGTEEDLNLVPSDVSNIDYDKFYSALSVTKIWFKEN
jgi:hypothetical protein